MNTIENKAENKRIMLVDEVDIIIPTKIHLEDNGYQVDIFTDPLLASSSYKANYYNLVITDIRMPEMNGFELYNIIKNRDSNIRVCFIC